MSLVELLSKKKTLEGKIEAEENRIQAIEDRKLADQKAIYDSKQQQLTKWNDACRDYLVDKGQVERFNAMLSQFTNEHIKYVIERDIGNVSKVFLQRIQPKSFSTLLSLYKLDGVLDALGTCDKPMTQQITEKDVLKAKKEYQKLQAKIADRRGN